jgi:hypothetical protein
MENKGLIPEDKLAKISEFLGFAGGLRDIKVASQDEYNNVVELCKKIKGMVNTLENDRKELVAPYKSITKEIDEKYREVRVQLENGEGVARRAMGVWYNKQEHKRIAAQRKAEAEAAEQRRAAAERAAMEAAKAEAYREQGREDMAEKAEARAEVAQVEAVSVVAPVIENKAKTDGISYRTTYKVVVDDMAKAVRGLAASEMLSKFLTIDTRAIERAVQGWGGDLALPDGLRVVVEKTPIVRGK